VHTDCEQLKSWFQETSKANGKIQYDKTAISKCSILNDNRFVFNIKGNKYRINSKF
jgi:mRNA interferase HigB